MPPLWITMIMMASLEFRQLEVNGKLIAGIVSPYPYTPISLLLLTALTPSFGKHFKRLAANCSAMQATEILHTLSTECRLDLCEIQWYRPGAPVVSFEHTAQDAMLSFS